MPDLPDTVADVQDWKPLPVPLVDVSLICQVQPISVTFKAAPGAISQGFVLQPGKAIRLKAGDAGHIKPAGALGGIAVLEVFG